MYGRTERKAVAGNRTGMSLSPDGARMVVTARGEVFDVPVEAGVTRNMSLDEDGKGLVAEVFLEVHPALDVHVEDDDVPAGPDAVHFRLERAVEAVGIDFLELDELVVPHQEAEDVGGVEEVFHAVLLFAARRPGSGRDGELDALVAAQDMVHDGAFARSGGRGENQYFVHGPIALKMLQNYEKNAKFADAYPSDIV